MSQHNLIKASLTLCFMQLLINSSVLSMHLATKAIRCIAGQKKRVKDLHHHFQQLPKISPKILKPLYKFSGNPINDQVTQLNNDGLAIIDNKNVELWHEGVKGKTLEHVETVMKIASYEKGNNLVSLSANFATVWDMYSGEMLSQIKTPPGGFTDAAFTKDGILILSSLNNYCSIMSVDPQDGKTLDIENIIGGIFSIGVHPQVDELIAVYGLNILSMLQKNGKFTTKFEWQVPKKCSGEWHYATIYNGDEKRLLTIANTYSGTLWNPEERELVRIWNYNERRLIKQWLFYKAIFYAQVKPNTKEVLIGHADHAKIFTAKRSKPRKILPSIKFAQYHPSNNTMLVVDSEGNLCIVDAHNYTPLFVCQDYNKADNRPQFSKDGKKVISAHAVWELPNNAKE